VICEGTGANPARRRLRRGGAQSFMSCGPDSVEWGPVIQFSSSLYYCFEEDECVDVHVVRLGDRTGYSEVSYTTKDASAKAESSYKAISGTLVFEPGCGEQIIQVPLIVTGEWRPTLDFVVELTEEGLKDAELGRYLCQTQVKVDHCNTFPSNYHLESCLARTASVFARNLQRAPTVALLLEYFKLNWRNRKIRSGTVKTLLKDQCHNLYFVIRLFMNVYLVDYVLKGSRDFTFEDRTSSLAMIMAVMVLPLALLHFLDYRSISWRIGGTARIELQSALLRRFLNYEDASRLNLNQGDLSLAMTRDTVNLVSKGYLNVLHLTAQLGKLLMVLAYQWVAPAIFGNPLTASQIQESILPLLIYPVVLFCFLRVRRRRITQVLQKQYLKENSIVRHVESTVLNFRLVADYGRRAEVTEAFESEVRDFNDASVEALQVLQNDTYFSKWISALLVALYTGFGGVRVLQGSLALGLFLTQVHIFVQIGEAWGHIYQSLLDMQMVLPGLQRIMFLMNLPTEMKERMRLNQHCQVKTNALQETMPKTAASGVRVDRLPIVIEDLTCSYPIRSHCGVCTTKEVFLQGRMAIEQGQLISLVGPRGGGKSTLLKVIGGAKLPCVDGSSGFFIPSHLRVLHISSEPMFFQGTLYENLTFGVEEGDPDRSLERVTAICRRLLLPYELLEYLQMEEQLAWGEIVSLSQRHLLCIARALIANPDVLAIHKPTLAFDESTSKHVLELLKEFVDKRGIEQDPATWNRRRPRSCIITSSKKHGVQLADKVFHVSEDDGIQPQDKNEVTKEMLM